MILERLLSMIDLSNIEGIYLYCGTTDMRKGINGLVGLTQEIIEKKDMAHRLFIFCGKDKRNLKILEMDYDGYWLYQKRLVTGKFKWPKSSEDSIVIEKRQLQWLLEGLSIIQPTAHKNVLNPE